MPPRGLTMAQVEQRFGAPAERFAAVGQPPITRWVYPAFVVYFEVPPRHSRGRAPPRTERLIASSAVRRDVRAVC